MLLPLCGRAQHPAVGASARATHSRQPRHWPHEVAVGQASGVASHIRPLAGRCLLFAPRACVLSPILVLVWHPVPVVSSLCWARDRARELASNPTNARRESPVTQWKPARKTSANHTPGLGWQGKGVWPAAARRAWRCRAQALSARRACCPRQHEEYISGEFYVSPGMMLKSSADPRS